MDLKLRFCWAKKEKKACACVCVCTHVCVHVCMNVCWVAKKTSRQEHTTEAVEVCRSYGPVTFMREKVNLYCLESDRWASVPECPFTSHVTLAMLLHLCFISTSSSVK